MVTFEKRHGESSIKITIKGDREDYTQIIKSLLNLLGNVDKDRFVTAEELYYISSFIVDMLVAPEQICT